MRVLLVISLLAFCYTSVLATDAEREQRWVDQTVDSIFDGDPLYLETLDHRFLSIYMESETPSNKAIIVLHGTGFHPDWDQVVNPLRVSMTEHGWNTLSIQLPLLEKSAAYEDYVPLYPEVPPRLLAATHFLNEQGMQHIVIVAHSQGATMACYYLARHPHNIAALVAIGMSAQHRQANINSAESLKAIDIPVLDIYGSRDFPTVLETSELRAQGAAHNPHYQQRIIDEAYHFFDDTNHERQLLGSIQDWLEDVR